MDNAAGVSKEAGTTYPSGSSEFTHNDYSLIFVLNFICIRVMFALIRVLEIVLSIFASCCKISRNVIQINF